MSKDLKIFRESDKILLISIFYFKFPKKYKKINVTKLLIKIEVQKESFNVLLLF